jgi:hypothetical protein
MAGTIGWAWFKNHEDSARRARRGREFRECRARISEGASVTTYGRQLRPRTSLRSAVSIRPVTKGTAQRCADSRRAGKERRRLWPPRSIWSPLSSGGLLWSLRPSSRSTAGPTVPTTPKIEIDPLTAITGFQGRKRGRTARITAVVASGTLAGRKTPAPRAWGWVRRQGAGP